MVPVFSTQHLQSSSRQLWTLPHGSPQHNIYKAPPGSLVLHHIGPLVQTPLMFLSLFPQLCLISHAPVSDFCFFLCCFLFMDLHCSFVTISKIVMNHTDISLLYLYTVCLGSVLMQVEAETCGSSSGGLRKAPCFYCVCLFSYYRIVKDPYLLF